MVELYPLKVNVEELSIAFGESKIIVSFRFGSVQAKIGKLAKLLKISHPQTHLVQKQ